MFFHPSTVFFLFSGLCMAQCGPPVKCNITLTFIFKVCCFLLLNSHRSTHMFACLANRCVLLRIVEKLPDPDLSLHSETHDGLKYHERKQMRPLTLTCKVVLFLFFFFNQTMVAFLSLYFKLECFDKFPKAEVK